MSLKYAHAPACVFVVVYHFKTSIPKPLGKSKTNFMWRGSIFSWEGEVYINAPGHMTKMAAMPIYGKTFKNPYLQNQLSYDLQNLACSIRDSNSTKFIEMMTLG